MKITLFALALAIPGAALAQSQAESGQPPKRVRSVTLTTRGQACPPSTGDEVVVCTTIEEPYRIPSALRESAPSAANQSWVNRAASIDQTSMRAGGLPDTCSPIGTGGQSGCALQLNQAYAAERRARANGEVP
jgi:hypothetical protein